MSPKLSLLAKIAFDLTLYKHGIFYFVIFILRYFFSYTHIIYPIICKYYYIMGVFAFGLKEIPKFYKSLSRLCTLYFSNNI